MNNNFPVLKLVKNYLISIIVHKKLVNLAMILIEQDICEKLNIKEINKSEEDFIIKIIKIKNVFKYFCSLKLYIFFNYSKNNYSLNIIIMQIVILSN